MNIIVNPFGSENYYFRPDTTLEKEGGDYYCPETVEKLTVSPCIFAIISKAGKAVQRKFAERYCEKFGFGILLNDSGKSVFPGIGTSMDFTSVLPYNLSEVSKVDNGQFILKIDGKTVFSFSGNGEIKNKLLNMITSVSLKSSLRIGDLIVIELSEDYKSPRGCRIEGLSNGYERALFSFKIN